MSCIRDRDRLADDRSDRSVTDRDADSRSTTLNDRLGDWLNDRMTRGDITYIATVNGAQVFRALRALYEECDGTTSDE